MSVRKLLHPIYGIVEAERLWKLLSVRWIKLQGLKEVPGLSKLFVRWNPEARLVLLANKIVADIFLIASGTEISRFHEAK